MNLLQKLQFFTLLILLPIFVFSSNTEVIPPSIEFGLDKINKVYTILDVPDIKNSSNKYDPLQAGYILELTDQNKYWSIEKVDNKTIARIQISVPGAKALNIYSGNISLKKGDIIYIYDPDVENVLVYDFNDSKIVSDFISGDNIIVEYYSTSSSDFNYFNIKEIGVLLNDNRGFGDAGNCEVHINCVEGEDWQNQKKGVARILVKDGSSTFWCTGSLINNTSQDQKPYFLTANHCGQNSDSTDYSEWMFYFNFESPFCGEPPLEPDYDLITGSVLKANSKSGTSSSSDFKLLELSEKINPDLKPYFNGWDRRGNSSNSGVTIHHPQGDVKMISTYNAPLKSTRYDSDTEDPEGLFWRVSWAETVSGHGVTEGGSSGSPLFNESGLIIGALTGGRASCTYLDEGDFYGKFNRSFTNNLLDSTSNLEYWLDPAGTGATVLLGSNFDSTSVYAGFSVEKSVITVGESIEFINTSYGNISSYSWEFEGGTPEFSEQEEPGFIVYNKSGEYGVRLIVKSAEALDSLYIPNFITVLPNLAPNPTSNGEFKISFGGEIPDDYDLNIYDSSGRPVSFSISETGVDYLQINVAHKRSGVYIVNLESGGKITNYKLLIIG